MFWFSLSLNINNAYVLQCFPPLTIILHLFLRSSCRFSTSTIMTTWGTLWRSRTHAGWMETTGFVALLVCSWCFLNVFFFFPASVFMFLPCYCRTSLFSIWCSPPTVEMCLPWEGTAFTSKPDYCFPCVADGLQDVNTNLGVDKTYRWDTNEMKCKHKVSD